MSRMTVKLLEAVVEDLKKRVEALEAQAPKRRVGFEYEGTVGGDMLEQHYLEDEIGDHKTRG